MTGRRRFLLGAAAVVGLAGVPVGVRPARSASRVVRGTWHRHPIPRYPNGIGSASKHTRWAYRPRSGDWYVNGGDYTQPGEKPAALDSGSNNTWRVDLRTGAWERLVGYWPKDGEIVPSHPDETTFVYDSRRDLFWQGGGFQWKPFSPGKGRDNSSVPPELQDRLIYDRWMSFDPAQRRWKDEAPITKAVHGGKARFGHYDEESDTVYVPYTDGSGNGIARFHCEKRQWLSSVRLGAPLVRYMGTDYSLLDGKRRRLVFMRDGDSALCAWEIASGRWHELPTSARPPARRHNSYGMAYHARLDLYARHGGREGRGDAERLTLTNDLWVVSADGGEWQRVELDGDGPTPRGTQTLLYDPGMDALISFGGTGATGDGAYFSARLEVA